LCTEHGLDWRAVKTEIFKKDYMGGEWSCDADGTKNVSWRKKLFRTGKISKEEMEDDDLSVLEIRRPVWMKIEVSILC
jgi:hypothetical protein